jgi:hypothetical protein
MKETYFVELVEVPEDDRVVRKLREQFLAHLPPPLLLFFPRHVFLIRSIGRLSVVTAEEGVFAEYEVLRVDPIISFNVRLVPEYILEIEIVPVRSQGRWRYGGGVREEIVAPLRPKRSGETHERHLDRRGSGGEDFVPSTPSITIQVDQDVYAVCHDLFNNSVGTPLTHVVEHRSLALDLFPVY